MKLLYAILLTAIIFTSCQSSDKETKSIVAELDCKRILIPEQLSFQVLDAFVDIKSQTYDYTRDSIIALLKHKFKYHEK